MSRSNEKLIGDLSVKKKGQLIQFAPYSTELVRLLEEDVKFSSYKTKTKYLNTLIGSVLSLERRFESRSFIEELFRRLALTEALPIEHIRALAPTQHRNFDQMLMHLLQTALSDYPDPTPLDLRVFHQRAAPAKDTASNQALNND
ncbi:MAG: hypothetical protein HC800_17780 [Phormidesmis sp. RL_2_1]|nr:hypothetical protein [Phormidesmis sp. RL_2_1]